MAKKLVRYLLEGDGTVPLFVSNGGYWPVGGELVGASVDEDERHVPASVVRMTKADLLARLASMNLKDPETQELLDEEAQAEKAQAWLDMVDLSDLA